jgi:hypothetical protein
MQSYEVSVREELICHFLDIQLDLSTLLKITVQYAQ